MRVERGPEWKALPDALRKRIEAGITRIESAISAIAAGACVRTMPPFIFESVVYATPAGKIVHATSLNLESPSGPPEIGVVVSVTAALCEDETIVKALLLHEVCHCFQTAKLITDHNDLGASLADLRGDPLDEERDRRLLARLPDWFSRSVGEVISRGDGIVATEEIQALLDAGHLTLSEPPRSARGIPRVPAEWAAHVRGLRQK